MARAAPDEDSPEGDHQRRRTMRSILTILLLCVLTGPRIFAQTTKSGFFITSDGVRIHCVEAGEGRPIVFIPGWRMPGWIWQKQIDELADFNDEEDLGTLPRPTRPPRVAYGDPAGNDIGFTAGTLRRTAAILGRAYPRCSEGHAKRIGIAGGRSLDLGGPLQRHALRRESSGQFSGPMETGSGSPPEHAGRRSMRCDRGAQGFPCRRAARCS